MIYDKLTNSSRYHFPALFMQAFDYVSSLTDSVPLGSTTLQGGVTAAVSEYTTKHFIEAKPETHRRFIDIQILLAGQELIGWYPEASLAISEPYNPQRDVEFYHQKKILSHDCFLSMQPGYFAVFFPWDIHMPQVCLYTPALIKKVVCKISIDIWK